jgi:hypothetical protein
MFFTVIFIFYFYRWNFDGFFATKKWYSPGRRGNENEERKKQNRKNIHISLIL